MEVAGEVLSQIIDELDRRRKVDALKTIVSVNEAARVLERDRGFIYDLINEGYLRKVKIKGSSYVTKSSLEKLQLTGTK